jgi:glycerol uptake facilitator-like aquaporin
VSLIAALLAEFVLTAVLLIVVMSTAVYQRAPGGAMPAGLAVGLWIGCAVFLAFPISGGSLNPARTLGPDIVSAAFPAVWIYIVGPLAGAAFGGWIWQYLKRGRQPDSEAGPETGGTSQDGQAGRAEQDGSREEEPSVRRG